MFKFMKRSIGTKKEISTATMSTDEYIAAIEGGIIPYWADKILMEKTGIKDLFDENVQVVKKLSYDDACDCLQRANKMVDMATYVFTTFGKRSRELEYLSDSSAFSKHLDNVAAGRASGEFKVKHDFYSADTIRDLFIEAQNNATLSEYEAPVNLDEAMSRLNSAVGTLRMVKDCTFMTIKCSAMSAMADLSGFKS